MGAPAGQGTRPRTFWVAIALWSLTAVVGAVLVGTLVTRDDDAPGTNDAAAALALVPDLAAELYWAHTFTDEALGADPTVVAHTEWTESVDLAVVAWEAVAADAEVLGDAAATIPEGQALWMIAAVDAAEITSVFDAAPAGRRLATLAEHLGVDARRALAELRTAQAQLTADAWNEAGDTFETLENAARVIGDAAKVGLYVGGAVLSGGAATTVGTILGEAGAIIGGADLVLQIGQDASAIALGYNHDVTAMFAGMRQLSEPAATVIGMVNLDGAFAAVTFGAEQISAALLENKYLGVEIDWAAAAVRADGLDEPAASAWLAERGMSQTPAPAAELVPDWRALGLDAGASPAPTTATSSTTLPAGIEPFLGSWHMVSYISFDGSDRLTDEAPQSLLTVNPDGTAVYGTIEDPDGALFHYEPSDRTGRFLLADGEWQGPGLEGGPSDYEILLDGARLVLLHTPGRDLEPPNEYQIMERD